MDFEDVPSALFTHTVSFTSLPVLRYKWLLVFSSVKHCKSGVASEEISEPARGKHLFGSVLHLPVRLRKVCNKI